MIHTLSKVLVVNLHILLYAVYPINYTIFRAVELSPEIEAAFILRTSGTTGLNKGTFYFVYEMQ